MSFVDNVFALLRRENIFKARQRFNPLSDSGGIEIYQDTSDNGIINSKNDKTIILGHENTSYIRLGSWGDHWNFKLSDGSFFHYQAGASKGNGTINCLAYYEEGYELAPCPVRLEWSYSSGTPIIDDDLNVSSLTDTSTGNITVNFETALQNTHYAMAACTDANSQYHVAMGSPLTTSVQVIIRRASTEVAGDQNGRMAILGGI